MGLLINQIDKTDYFSAESYVNSTGTTISSNMQCGSLTSKYIDSDSSSCPIDQYLQCYKWCHACDASIDRPRSSNWVILIGYMSEK
jgi:translation initiation factor 2 beta subunit (eIF-2beta)/eIF-5